MEALSCSLLTAFPMFSTCNYCIPFIIWEGRWQSPIIVTTETKPAVFKCQCAYVYGTRPASMGLDVGQGGTWRRDSALPSIERTEKQTVKGDHVRGGRWAA